VACRALPERVESFVLMGAAGVEFELTPGLDAVWGYEPSVENMRRIVMSFAYDTSMMTDDLVRSRYEASVRPGYQESFSKMFAAPRQRHIKALATPEEHIRKIQQRALIHGATTGGAADQQLFHSLPNSDLHMFGKCGH
jgi:2-hydroxymuconate-semialdehyde hydrolase